MGDNQLCRAAAGKCIGEIRDAIGPNIFNGRLEDDQKELLARSKDVPVLSGTVFLTLLPEL